MLSSIRYPGVDVSAIRGKMYYYGRGVKQDYAEAVKYLGSGGNDSESLFLLGEMYHEGLGVKADQKKALEYLNQSADLGYVPAMAMLGTMYFEGKGTPKDYEMAVRWL